MSKLKVSTKKDGFRRAGFVFNEKQPMIIDTETLPADKRKEIVDALKNEPMLVVDEFYGDALEVKEAMASDLQQASLEIAALHKQHAVSVQTIKELEDKVIDGEISLKDKVQEFETLQTAVANKDELVRELQETVVSLQTTVLDVSSKRDELQTKLDEANKEITALKAAVKKAAKA